MALTTYAELKTEVQNWINKSSISASADDFVTLAEGYLNNEIRTRQMLARQDFTIDANPEDLSSQLTRFVRIKTLSISVGGEDTILNYLSPDLMQARYSDKSSGVPEFYTLIADDLYVDPPPNGSYTATCMYYQRLAALSTTVNWLYSNHPHIYLYASLAEAAIFAKDGNAAKNYIALRDRSIAMLKRMDVRDRQGGTSRMISEVRAV